MAVFRDPDRPESEDSREPAAGPARPAQERPAEPPPRAESDPAPDSLASVFDDWQWDLYQTVPPSKRLEERLTELLSGVESWKAEVQTSTGELQSRLFGEMRILEAKLEGLANTGAEGQEGVKQALRTIWRETQQVSSAVQAWSSSSQTGVEDRAKLVQALEFIAQRVAEAQDNVLERQQTVASQLAALVDALKATQARADLLVQEGDARVSKVLETVDAGLAERHDAAQAATEHLLGSLKERLALLQTTTALVAEGHDRLQQSVAGVAEALTAAADERTELKAQVAALTESVNQLKSDVKEAATQSEVRVRQHLESVESRTLAAISDLSLALLEEHRATKLELQNRIDRGVREPLKNAVSLLSKQLSDVETMVERTFDTLRNADLTLKIDNVDSLLDPRYRKSQPYDLVELPSPGRGSDGPSSGPAGD
ncbi:MAG TPA: hypothetical protein VHL54_13480 [Actinomycetota bacterium]|nr:hypothetical protein [Actinomycetota bacterium]